MVRFEGIGYESLGLIWKMLQICFYFF